MCVCVRVCFIVVVDIVFHLLFCFLSGICVGWWEVEGGWGWCLMSQKRSKYTDTGPTRPGTDPITPVKLDTRASSFD